MPVLSEFISKFVPPQEPDRISDFAIKFTEAPPEEMPHYIIDSIRFGIDGGTSQAINVHQETFKNPPLPVMEKVIFIANNIPSQHKPKQIPVFKPGLAY